MKSLSARLVVTAVALVALVSLLIGTATAVLMKDRLTDRLDGEVHEAAERAARGDDRGFGRGQDRFSGQGSLRAAFVEGSEPVASVIGDDPDDELGPQDLSSAAVDVLADVPADGDVHSVDLPGVGDYRVEARDVTFQDVVTDETGPGTLVIGLPATDVEDAIADLIWIEVLLGVLGVVAAALIGRVVVHRQLAPLREVAATAHEVATLPLESGEVDLSPRVSDPDEATEVGRVGAALNALLAHVETSLSARHRSEQQVRQFVADASHELRTPLTTIRGYAELSRRTPEDAAALSGSLAKVSTEADRMAGLVDDLLLLARLDSGRPLAREAVDLTRLLLEAVGDARVVGPGHRWRLELPDEPLEIVGDEQRLHQVVTNLLANARRHTPTGTTVTVSATPSAGDATPSAGVELVVADDGPGFPAELTATAFERFTRADVARTRESGGAGLGLSIVAAIVRAHGGEVGLDSRPGATRVTIRLPYLTRLDPVATPS